MKFRLHPLHCVEISRHLLLKYSKRLAFFGDRTTRLYNGLLQLGMHLEAFKKANVIMLPKPRKRDRTLPSSCQPICLISFLGKELKCLIARRTSYWALELKIRARDLCTAISRRSTIDLTTALHFDLRKAWKKDKVAWIVTVNVKGAFERVLSNRQFFKLRTQRWPKNLIEWVSSFLSGRTARVCLDGVYTDPLPIMHRLPQGSPVSHILFLLYLEPLLKTSRVLFGYAFDAAILGSAYFLDEYHSEW